MRHRVTVVVLCMYLSVTALATIYLIYTSKIQCHRVLCGVFKVFYHLGFTESALFIIC